MRSEIKAISMNLDHGYCAPPDGCGPLAGSPVLPTQSELSACNRLRYCLSMGSCLHQERFQETNGFHSVKSSPEALPVPFNEIVVTDYAKIAVNFAISLRKKMI